MHLKRAYFKWRIMSTITELAPNLFIIPPSTCLTVRFQLHKARTRGDLMLNCAFNSQSCDVKSKTPSSDHRDPLHIRNASMIVASTIVCTRSYGLVVWSKFRDW
ncbi:hypothetical protein AVEN_273047-1, partial [Araneus ventricosus]